MCGTVWYLGPVVQRDGTALSALEVRSYSLFTIGIIENLHVKQMHKQVQHGKTTAAVRAATECMTYGVNSSRQNSHKMYRTMKL